MSGSPQIFPVRQTAQTLALCLSLTTGAARAVESNETTTGATSKKPPSDDTSSPANPQAYGGRAWQIGLTQGYYATTSTALGLKINPYGIGYGLTASWMHRSGWSFGLHGQYFLGRTISQVYEPPLTTFVVPVDAESRVTSVAATFAYEMPLDPLVFRFALDLGLSALSWDFGETGFISLAGFPTTVGSAVGMHVAPGVGVLLPLGSFYVGAEIRSRLELITYLPDAFGGHAHAGWRFK